MGRSPCCTGKLGLKKGPWTLEEDQKLLAYIDQHGHGNWRVVPVKADLQRCGKSCRLRWTNYLRSDIKRGKFSLKEEQTIIQLHALLGNRWSAIATHLPKITDNEIKNYWNTHLKKRLAKMGIDPVTHKAKNDALASTANGAQPIRIAATLNHMAQWESTGLEAEGRVVRQSKLHSDPSAFTTTHHRPHQMNNLNYNNINNSNSSTINLPRCLDMFKAWHGVWPSTSTTTVDTLAGGGVGLRIESPTSTLSFSENEPTVPIAGPMIEIISHNDSNNNNNNQVEHYRLVKEEGEQEWKIGGFSRHHHDHHFSHNRSHYHDNHDHGTTTMLENYVSSSSGHHDHNVEAKNNDDEEDYDDEGGANDYDKQSFMEGFTELLLGAATTTTNANTDDRSNGSRDCFEDNNNYWDNILNLVNSSAFDSSMF